MINTEIHKERESIGARLAKKNARFPELKSKFLVVSTPPIPEARERNAYISRAIGAYHLTSGVQRPANGEIQMKKGSVIQDAIRAEIDKKRSFQTVQRHSLQEKSQNLLEHSRSMQRISRFEHGNVSLQDRRFDFNPMHDMQEAARGGPVPDKRFDFNPTYDLHQTTRGETGRMAKLNNCSFSGAVQPRAPVLRAKRPSRLQQLVKPSPSNFEAIHPDGRPVIRQASDDIVTTAAKKKSDITAGLDKAKEKGNNTDKKKRQEKLKIRHTKKTAQIKEQLKQQKEEEKSKETHRKIFGIDRNSSVVTDVDNRTVINHPPPNFVAYPHIEVQGNKVEAVTPSTVCDFLAFLAPPSFVSRESMEGCRIQLPVYMDNGGDAEAFTDDEHSDSGMATISSNTYRTSCNTLTAHSSPSMPSLASRCPLERSCFSDDLALNNMFRESHLSAYPVSNAGTRIHSACGSTGSVSGIQLAPVAPCTSPRSTQSSSSLESTTSPRCGCDKAFIGPIQSLVSKCVATKVNAQSNRRNMPLRITELSLSPFSVSATKAADYKSIKPKVTKSQQQPLTARDSEREDAPLQVCITMNWTHETVVDHPDIGPITKRSSPIAIERTSPDGKSDTPLPEIVKNPSDTPLPEIVKNPTTKFPSYRKQVPAIPSVIPFQKVQVPKASTTAVVSAISIQMHTSRTVRPVVDSPPIPLYVSPEPAHMQRMRNKSKAPTAAGRPRPLEKTAPRKPKPTSGTSIALVKGNMKPFSKPITKSTCKETKRGRVNIKLGTLVKATASGCSLACGSVGSAAIMGPQPSPAISSCTMVSEVDKKGTNVPYATDNTDPTHDDSIKADELVEEEHLKDVTCMSDNTNGISHLEDIDEYSYNGTHSPQNSLSMESEMDIVLSDM